MSRMCQLPKNCKRNSVVTLLVATMPLPHLQGSPSMLTLIKRETVGARTKDAIQKGYSYLIMIGDKDIANGTFAVRSRDDRKIKNMTSDEIYKMFIALEQSYK